MKRVIASLVVLAMFSVNAIAQEKKEEKEKAKTEKSCNKDKKACSNKDKKACCAAKK